MNMNISYDIAALFLCIGLMFVVYYKKWIPTFQNKIFSAMLWVSLAAIILDILDVALTINAGIFPKIFDLLILYIYFITIDLIPILFVIYVMAMKDGQGLLLKGVRKYLFIVPMALIILIFLLNPIFEWLIYYDGSQYVRSYGILILDGFAFYYLAFGIVEVFIVRHILTKEKTLLLYSFPIIGTISVIIQIINPLELVTMFGIVLCLLLMYFTIQNYEAVSHTGYLNRVAFSTIINMFYKRNERFSVIAISIRDYSYLKKTFGQEIVHEASRVAGSRLEGHVNRNNLIYYIGTGRYVLVYPQKDADMELTKLIDKEFDQDIAAFNVKIKLDIKQCIINCPDDIDSGRNLLDVVHRFDQLMEENATVVYYKDLNIIEESRIKEIEEAIDRGLKNNNFEVIYQPIYSIEKAKFKNAEALLRLKDPILGYVSPEEFIEVAERTGQILVLGDYIIEEVCQLYSEEKLNEYGFDAIEVNVSVAQCVQANLSEHILSIIDKYNMPHQAIILELTESLATSSPERVMQMMNKMIKEGIVFALDDFGTGYANLRSIVAYPFSIIKLDKGLIDQIDDERGAILLSNAIETFINMNLIVVAEGVETKEQATKLIKMGCKYIQGYYYAKPLSRDLFIQLIKA